MCDPIVAGALIGTAASGIGSLTSPSPTAGSNINLTREGATKFQNQLQPLIDVLLKGGDAPNIGNLAKYFDQAQSNLYGQMQRDAGGAGNQWAAKMLSSGFNPNVAYNLARGRVANEYAGSLGNLAATRASAMYGANNSMLTQLLGLTQGNIAMGAGSSAPTGSSSTNQRTTPPTYNSTPSGGGTYGSNSGAGGTWFQDGGSWTPDPVHEGWERNTKTGQIRRTGT